MVNHSNNNDNIGEGSNTNPNNTDTMIVSQSGSTDSEQPSLEVTPLQVQQVPPRTPTPSLPKRPDMSTATKLDTAWHSSTVSLLHIDVLDELDDNGNLAAATNSDSHEQCRASDKRLNTVYGQSQNRRHSSYDYGVPVDYQNGANTNRHSTYSSIETAAGSSTNEGTLQVLAALRRTSDPTPPLVPQGPEPALQDKRAQRSWGQGLKRSSQVFPMVHSPRTLEQGDSDPHQKPKGRGWKQRWQRNKKNNDAGGNRISNAATLTGSDTDEGKITDKEMARELSQDEKEKLEELFRKKKTQPQWEEVRQSSETLRPDRHPTKTRWIDQLSGCIPLGWMATLICVFMLGYNGVLSAMIFQASQFPDSIDLPVFVCSILFMFAAALSLPGFVSVAFMSPFNSRASRFIFKSFHLLYFFTSFLTWGCMMAWLGLNKVRTGSWDRMHLSISNNVGFLTFESLLKQDPVNAEWWMINPYVWIVVFTAIWVSQVYSWICLVAYRRKHSSSQTAKREGGFD